jgi:SpoVK/Ycf46/Vps4 family AAA+-type ATPase
MRVTLTSGETKVSLNREQVRVLADLLHAYRSADYTATGEEKAEIDLRKRTIKITKSSSKLGQVFAAIE